MLRGDKIFIWKKGCRLKNKSCFQIFYLISREMFLKLTVHSLIYIEKYKYDQISTSWKPAPTCSWTVGQIHAHISHICMAFLQCALSCVSPCQLSAGILCHICHICTASIKQNLSKNQVHPLHNFVSNKACSHLNHILGARKSRCLRIHKSSQLFSFCAKDVYSTEV